jgi:ubiquinone/menaquinone biosynthesis C-methylase UbiE
MQAGEETTFRNFTVQQAREYNASRGHAYPSKLYEHIVAYHKDKGGQVNLALDLGCGPGNATRDLAAYFDHVIGLDGSPEMINAARELIPKQTKGNVSFENVPSEEIHETPGVEEESVDVITVATAVG